jgi:hypothetical protein
VAEEKSRREEAARKERELSDKLSALDTKNHKQPPIAARDNKNFIVPISPNTNDIVYPQDPDMPEDDSEYSLARDDPLSPPSNFVVPDRSLKPSKLEIPTGYAPKWMTCKICDLIVITIKTSVFKKQKINFASHC